MENLQQHRMCDTKSCSTCNSHASYHAYVSDTPAVGPSLSLLPTEVLEYTLTFSNTKSVLNFTSTCKTFRSQADRLVPIGLENEKNDVFELFSYIVNNAVPAYSKAVPWFVTAGVDVNRRIFWEEDDLFYGNGYTPLSLATKEGCKDMVIALLSQHADVNKGNIDGKTPLHLAALHGSTDLIELLVKSGCEVNKGERNGATPFLSTALSGHIEAMKLLAKLGADINKPMHNGGTPLFGAAFFRNISMVNALIEINADINKPRCNGATPISMAAEEGLTNIAESLINAGADVSKERNDGLTPYDLAEKKGYKIIANMLKGRELVKEVRSRSMVQYA